MAFAVHKNMVADATAILQLEPNMALEHICQGTRTHSEL